MSHLESNNPQSDQIPSPDNGGENESEVGTQLLVEWLASRPPGHAERDFIEALINPDLPVEVIIQDILQAEKGKLAVTVKLLLAASTIIQKTASYIPISGYAGPESIDLMHALQDFTIKVNSGEGMWSPDWKISSFGDTSAFNFLVAELEMLRTEHAEAIAIFNEARGN